MNTPYPVISVMMVSYNHGQFIAQALESVINQKANYSIELIISDDCSTDNTKEIIERYVKKHPELIKAHYQQINIGMGENWLFTLSNCKGKYVALLEGDDYWVDEFKLQKQVDFLEANENYSVCFTRVYELINNNISVAPLNPWEQEKSFDIYDLAKGNFIHTPSVLFRNGLIKEFPTWFSKSPVCDYVLHLINSQSGLIKYLPESTAVYRMFAGTWSSMPAASQIIKFIKVLDYLLLENFDALVKSALRKQRQNLLLEYCGIMLRDNNFEYLEHLDKELAGESDFVRKWMLLIYPDRIREIRGSRAYRFALFIARMKNKLYF